MCPLSRLQDVALPLGATLEKPFSARWRSCVSPLASLPELNPPHDPKPWLLCAFLQRGWPALSHSCATYHMAELEPTWTCNNGSPAKHCKAAMENCRRSRVLTIMEKNTHKITYRPEPQWQGKTVSRAMFKKKTGEKNSKTSTHWPSLAISFFPSAFWCLSKCSQNQCHFYKQKSTTFLSLTFVISQRQFLNCIFIYLLGFFETGSHYVAVLKLWIFLSQPLKVLGLQGCTTTPGFHS
jgi:hypothetical protein